MERREAIELLKTLIELNLAQPSFVSLQKNEKGSFDLEMKVNGNLEAIRAFAAGRDLMLNEDTEKGTCIISKR